MKILKKIFQFCLKAILVTGVLVYGFISCEPNKFDVDEVPLGEANTLVRQNNKINGKIDICHHDLKNDDWNVISVSENSWSAHSQHGDVRLDDQDGDGYVPSNECGIGPMGDCNDLDETINPIASEILGDGIDQDCDGTDFSTECPCFTAADLEQVGRPTYRVVGWGPCLLQISDGLGNVTFNAAAGCGVFGDILPGYDEAWLVDFVNGTVNWTPATKQECGGLTAGEVFACQQLICARANAVDMFNGSLDCNMGLNLKQVSLSTSNFKDNSEYNLQIMIDGGPFKIMAKKK